MREINAILTIAYRDFMKLMRDPARLVSSLVMPLLFITILGGSMQANMGKGLGFDFMPYIFTGVFAQSLFQSAAMGIVSLIDDRENDFSQEIFISPISRYSIILGKISFTSTLSIRTHLFPSVIVTRYFPSQRFGLIFCC